MEDSHWGVEWGLMTEKCIEALVLAQQEARFLQDPRVGTEHALIGLLSSHNPGADLLLEWSVDLHVVRATLEMFRTRGEHEVLRRFSWHLRKSIERALEEAQSAGQLFVTTDHLYLGLLAQEDSKAVRLLETLHVDCAALAARLRARGAGERPSGGAPLRPEQLLVELRVAEDNIPASERVPEDAPLVGGGPSKLALEQLIEVLDELGAGLQAAQQSLLEALHSEPVPALLIASPDENGWPVVDEEAYQIGGLVRQILSGALARKAERVVFDPVGDMLRVAYHSAAGEVQGVEIPAILRYVLPFKIMRMAGLNPFDKSREADGRLTLHVRGRSHRFEVRSEPVLKGFRVVVVVASEAL